MAATMETQRLISVSLGKIAQSRGQRGGINLHKNLLVATVLHKARTAIMMETYHQSLLRQKQCSAPPVFQHQQQQQAAVVAPAPQISAPAAVPTLGCAVPIKADVYQTSHDSNLDQSRVTPCAAEESRSSVTFHEPMAVSDRDEVHNKENAPPSCATRLSSNESPSSSPISNNEGNMDHLSAATQLSYEARMAAFDTTGCNNNNLTSASPTCNVLKRRRENNSACFMDTESECPVSKKAKVSSCSSFSNGFLSEQDASSDESDSEAELEMIHSPDSPQITNLVSIFHSGFAGLTNSRDGDSDSEGYQSDLDVTGSSQFKPLGKLRPESPSPSYSRKMSESSLMCSSQIGRLESLPSAIVLSA